MEDNRYKTGKIYAIRSHQTDDIYIGSTINDLYKRFYEHKQKYKKWIEGKTDYTSSYDIIKYDDCYIELVENFPCNNRNELHRKEGEHIRACDCVNKFIAGRTEKEYYIDNKDEISEKQKQYRMDNKEIIKEYYAKNKDEILEKQKQYHAKNKDEILEKKKEYRAKNKDILSEKKKEYYIDNKDEILEKRKEYHAKNKDIISDYKKQYYINKKLNLNTSSLSVSSP